ncbi:MAG: hypothetical protein A2855_01340 [Candidatus Liptonbacteria bacterium RIFCSPHIGHO2_01_FULL_57_28]|uniref:DUF2178 domain-containing protein n=1 Tax=Candidatus Liptonbacteria bacterium RIFCSPHIGHO2_01_FULL_57_28 TaxID=1798647 RepID=A0A1G2CE01_9BACT|nr:MAG: hypothetical protein A2855_01340 [Candidatus Liptonbacteria bacterium RIFCSPHIGHO2_01_FULL_57_28]
MKNNILSIAIALAFVALLILLTDPFMAWMPPAGLAAVLLAVAVLMCAWIGFIIYERAGDEREEAHRMQAGRAAYLSGIAVLTVALVVQGLAHDIDPWISGALAAMVLVKLAARLYSERYR